MKDIMVKNIEQVLERGEKIDNLVTKTDDLRHHVRSCFLKSVISCDSRLHNFNNKDRDYDRRCGGRISR